MHKTLLATLIITTSMLSIPAFAQVNLGVTARVGASVNAGAVVPNPMHAVDQTGTQAGHTLQRVDHKAKHTAHQASVQTRSTVNDNARVNASGAAGASTADSHAAMNANVNTAASVDAAAAAKRARGQSIGADAKVNANADAHGH